MAFTPEDGTGVTDANSYVDIDFADDYHSLRGNAAWASATEPQKQAALVKATDYVDQKYNFIGYETYEGQSLAWPRDYEDENLGIPAKLKQAIAELALEALTADLNPNVAPAGQVKRKKVDVVEVEYFASGASITIRRRIDGLLKGLVSGSPFNVPVVRV